MALSPASRSRLTLCFKDEALEAEYKALVRPRVRRQLRFGLSVAIFMWGFLGLLTYVTTAAGERILAGTAAMVLYLALSLAHASASRSWLALQLNGAIANMAAGLLAVWMCHVEGIFDPLGPLVTSMMAVYSFTLLNVPFLTALGATLPYVAWCLYLIAVTPGIEDPAMQMAGISGLVAVGATASYLLESGRRQDFALRQVIDGQAQALAEERARQLGPYTLEKKLGEGGMGVVYRARHALLRRPTAVKLVSSSEASARELERFQREVQLTSQLSHPNIIAVYDYGRSAEGEFYYAMEYLPGIALDQLVKRWGPMPPSRVVHVLRQVCAGLDEAHHRGLVHRDIKPGNIIVSRIGRQLDVAKVLDFGLVKELSVDSDLTGDDHVVGTPAYMAPEALTDPNSLGPAGDLYAVGAVAFFLLTGRYVFTGRTVAEMVGHHIHTPASPPSRTSIQPIPASLDAVVLRCLAKEPSERHASAAELGAALEALDIPRWRPEDAREWWDRFDAARAARDKDHAAPTEVLERSLTVDLGRR